MNKRQQELCPCPTNRPQRQKLANELAQPDTLKQSTYTFQTPRTSQSDSLADHNQQEAPSLQPTCINFKLLSTNTNAQPPPAPRVIQQVALDASLMPTDSGDELAPKVGHVVVLDNFVGKRVVKQMLDWLTEPEWDHSEGPPNSKWSKDTIDQAGEEAGTSVHATWGAKDHVLHALQRCECPGQLEVQTQLAHVLKDYHVCHQPSTSMMSDTCGEVGKVDGSDVAQQPFFCAPFVCNAAMPRDTFTWHVDADPLILPPSHYTRHFARYPNGHPDKPYLVSFVLYLNDTWEDRFGAETQFLDQPTGLIFASLPRPCRGVLMDQDIWHRVTSPSPQAKQPRYSLVWKLALLPKNKGWEGYIECLGRATSTTQNQLDSRAAHLLDKVDPSDMQDPSCGSGRYVEATLGGSSTCQEANGGDVKVQNVGGVQGTCDQTRIETTRALAPKLPSGHSMDEEIKSVVDDGGDDCQVAIPMPVGVKRLTIFKSDKRGHLCFGSAAWLQAAGRK